MNTARLEICSGGIDKLSIIGCACLSVWNVILKKLNKTLQNRENSLRGRAGPDHCSSFLREVFILPNKCAVLGTCDWTLSRALAEIKGSNRKVPLLTALICKKIAVYHLHIKDSDIKTCMQLLFWCRIGRLVYCWNGQGLLKLLKLQGLNLNHGVLGFSSPWTILYYLKCF